MDSFSCKVKDRLIELIVPYPYCKECGAVFTDPNSSKYLRRAAADEYRRCSHLLTSSEIVKIRENLGMTQKDFAKFIHVGEASIKRWESHFIQDKGHDTLIRLKSDLVSARKNYLQLLSQTISSD